MADHRDGPRLVNALFPVFETLPPGQQAVFVRLMGGGGAQASSFSADDQIEEEVEEAKAHFRNRLQQRTKPS
jgi:hypothetical protein